MTMLTILIILVVITVIAVVIATAIKASDKAKSTTEPLPYRLKSNFFNQSEFSLFSILTTTLPADRLRIFPKVRMGDYIEPTNHGTDRWGSWNRIKSRHIDFLIWDTTKNRFTLAIELDGSSHYSKAAQESDEFKNQLFAAVGLPLHRVKVGTDFNSEVQGILNILVG